MLQQYLSLPREVHLLCLGSFINRAGSFIVPFMTIYLARHLGLGSAFATGAMGAFGLGSMLAGLTGGHLADRIGRRTVMLISLTGAAAMLLVFSRLTTPWLIHAVVFLYASITDMYRPAASAMLADLVEPARRALAFGLMYVAINLGFAVAPLIGGELAERSFQLLFFGDAATCAVYALIILSLIPETLPRSSGEPGAGSQPPADADDAATPPLGTKQIIDDNEWTARRAAGYILRDRAFLIFGLGALFMAMTFMQSVGTFPLYLSGLGYSEKTYGRIIAVNGILIVLFQLPLAAWLRRFRRERVMVASAIVVALGFALHVPAALPWHFVAALVIWTTGEMMQSPYMQAIVSDMAPPRLRGRYMGVFSLCFACALTVGVPIGGEILARAGGRALWIATVAAALVSAALFYAVRHRTAEPTPA